MSLPSYEEAIVHSRDISNILESYLDTSSLRNIVLVDKDHNKKYAKYLWADPIVRIAEGSKPFTRTIKFINGAKNFHEAVRSKVHILDFRKLQSLSQIYRADFAQCEMLISCDWVQRHTPWFPNLRFLILDGLREQDEQSLEAESLVQSAIPPMQILLSYHRVGTLDSSNIFLNRTMSEVMYLDVSYTYRGEAWTKTFREADTTNMRIAKLRGLRLTDTEFPKALLTRGGLRIWSLDLRDNFLRDPLLQDLHQFGFPSFDAALQRRDAIVTASDEDLYEPARFYCQEQAHELDAPFNTLVNMRNDTLDGFKAHTVACGNLIAEPSRSLSFEDPYIQVTGLTHLYLGGNKFTWQGIRSLLSNFTTRLQVLDAGSPLIVNTGEFAHLTLPHSITFAVPNCASLLHRRSGTRIQRLRIHHSLVTLTPTITQSGTQPGFKWNCLRQAEKMHKKHAFGAPFSPLDNYQISALSLVDIPTYSYGTITARLIEFLKQCHAQETRLAAARASSFQQHHRAPPLLSGLRILRLEFIDPHPDTMNTETDTGERSVSGDADADTYMASSGKDFSFFPEERVETRRASLASATIGSGMGKERRAEEEEEESGPAVPTSVIEALKEFRKTAPRWGGTLQIVRVSGTSAEVVEDQCNERELCTDG